MGGMTPLASHVRKTTLRGWPAILDGQIVVDVIQRIGAAGVLGQRVVVEVEAARERIEHHVFQDGAEAPRAGVNLRLGFGRQADHLGVAAVLEIENAVIAPAVLVVADQLARRVGGERSLAGAGEAEEQRHVARRAPRWRSSAWAARPRSGSRKLSTVKMVFLISPP